MSLDYSGGPDVMKSIFPRGRQGCVRVRVGEEGRSDMGP